LIPKKGDTTKIKNWRPISLLNCFYKLISRALTNRLKKVIDKLTPIAQKSYSQTRQCQEVLISVNDFIAACNARGLKGAVISLDISKAFDSVSHNFLENALKFYGFGENFIKWIKLIATGRSACIILPGNKLSRNFMLEQGNAQGDTISPFLFNLCYQLLIFKLEFDVQIEGIDPWQLGEEAEEANLPGSRRVFAFADDGNIIIKLTLGNIIRVRDILRDFGTISGLVCNIEKTSLMQIGSNDPISEEITELGFQTREKIVILGMAIGKVENENLEKIKSAVSKQINFWGRFCLSLPGRICIAKTMMYSQLNYLGCIIKIAENDCEQIQQKIFNFVTGKLNISRNRITLDPASGGLGLFEVKMFLTAQKIMWVKRALCKDDIWKRRLFKKSCGKLHLISANNIIEAENPIVFEIARCFGVFCDAFYKYKENYKKAYILNNNSLTLNIQQKRPITSEFFGEFWDTHKPEICDLNLKEVNNGGVFVPMNFFRESTGINLPDAKITSLRAVFDNARIKYGKREEVDKESTRIEDFLKKTEKR